METEKNPHVDSYEDLRRRVDTMNQEIDELQVQTSLGRRPWYKNAEAFIPLFVSAAALLFTVWSSIQTEGRIQRQDQHATRAELMGLIQRLHALPKERYEVDRDFASDPAARNFLGGQITGESTLLGQQAAELIEQLDGKVTATEYLATASALTDAGQSGLAEKLLTQALLVAEDALSEAMLRRAIGYARFLVGDLDGGRDAYRQALKVFEKYPESNRIFVATTQAYTESFWASSELNQGQCPDAWQHVRLAEGYTAEFPPTAAARIQTQITRDLVSKRCGAPTS